ncbi:MAG: filamentous hemagglutinin N-terminal domain-containing protein, partial [Verrucomicrobiae bacterium]|nr:filamentous hemagglutinin N-terminal domain-containing protein [Verrucomicrobiae bacterium]
MRRHEFSVSLRAPVARPLLFAFLTSLLLLGSGPGWLALAAPTGEQVVAGAADFHRDGNYTGITAANNTIIDYQSFNIYVGETVQFIQPSADATVLNRVTGSADPSIILGNLYANGQVYLVNPAGWVFGRDAVVSAAEIHAVAGWMSDADFLSGLNQFGNLEGGVFNQGTITAGAVSLIGREVVNSGQIFAPNGFVALAAGDDVLVGEDGQHVFIKMDRPAETTAPAVTNTGTIDTGSRGHAFLGAGDLYSLAIRQDGRIRGNQVEIDGGAQGLVEVSGQIDATGETGGRVTIDAVAIFGTEFRNVPTSESDITASSALGSQFSGTVELRTPDIDATSGALAVNPDVFDRSLVVTDLCQILRDSEFYVTGRGGIPENPRQFLEMQTTLDDLGEMVPFSSTQETEERANAVRPYSLTEATNWTT